ncbi:MAG: hypothetical protein E6Q24_21225 [Chitinophagaceae bacterium]|nr:MAG: hypothetical protein E6Q24_21225 [Chitinophagaceae bacterium]
MKKVCSINLPLLTVLIILLQAPIFGKAETGDSLTERYSESYLKIAELLKSNGSFKEAVFIAESAFQPDLSGALYDDHINVLTALTLYAKRNFHLSHYIDRDSTNYLLNRALFGTICDTIHFNIGSTEVTLLPLAYNFEDPTGKADWKNMFVTKLLATQKGNCRSLAYLYKILADETGAKCWLALAPGHIYIRNYSRKIGWYNTELTSATFPTDAWIAASGYVSTDAIRSGIYMDTLSNQQSIALCLLDLAKGYELQTNNYHDGFILQCCKLALQYHPLNPMALLLKAEALKQLYFWQMSEKKPAAATYAEMERAYITLAKLHYCQMPEKMYLQWLNSLAKEKDKYVNKRLISNAL